MFLTHTTDHNFVIRSIAYTETLPSRLFRGKTIHLDLFSNMLPKLLLSFFFLSLLAATLSNVIQQQETSDVQALRLKRSCSPSSGRINWVRFRLRLNCNEAQGQRDTVSLRTTTRTQSHFYFNVNLRMINALLEALFNSARQLTLYNRLAYIWDRHCDLNA